MQVNRIDNSTNFGARIKINKEGLGIIKRGMTDSAEMSGLGSSLITTGSTIIAIDTLDALVGKCNLLSPKLKNKVQNFVKYIDRG